MRKRNGKFCQKNETVLKLKFFNFKALFLANQNDTSHREPPIIIL